ncbi:Uncharacterised protein [Mycobacteroides abscessus subsp. massiliense]|uniref:hypothetical protein n=1 Tax=Mycobacteroides abscessus TaxID=36809 RepID=UPI0009A6C22C|nr:hypothetical protein [Mycobacteroides abscessus]SKU72069.1 Uncharacterised protein [Mycobacteroides abscessus subsp. massiliense]SKV04266.1 Uncharacterised protein [Mycobacteroides abscessus subsp. massiliense]
MPTREVVVSVAAYTDVNGVRDFALQGETIDVHPDHVERFDLLNVVPGASERPADVADADPDSENTGPEQAEPVLPAEPADVAEWLTAEQQWRDDVTAWLAAEGEASEAGELGDDERLNAVLDLSAPPKRARPSRAKG